LKAGKGKGKANTRKNIDQRIKTYLEFVNIEYKHWSM
jgi:hypothetical protein